MSEWIKPEDKMPEDDVPFRATDGKGHYVIRTMNQVHRRAEEPGLFTPALNGWGMEIVYWMPNPELPIPELPV